MRQNTQVARSLSTAPSSGPSTPPTPPSDSGPEETDATRAEQREADLKAGAEVLEEYEKSLKHRPKSAAELAADILKEPVGTVPKAKSVEGACGITPLRSERASDGSP